MSIAKNQALKECVEVLKSPYVQKWYEENLTSAPQTNTIKILEKGVDRGELSVKEALSICLIVGVQWNVKFEGVP